MGHHLVGVAEVATLLGVSRQRVDQLAGTYADFPAPEAELAAGRIWSREAIEGWLAVHPDRKPGREEGRTIMFERLTARARRAFALAQDEARGHGHNYLGCEHLVLGLLREGEGLAARALVGVGLTLESARAALARLLRTVPRVPGGAHDLPHASETHLPFTPRVKRALEEAEQGSLELAHNYVGTEHVLLGVLREGENVGCRLLVEAGLDLAALRLKILELMGFPQPRPPGDATPASVLDQLLAQMIAVAERLDRIERRLS